MRALAGIRVLDLTRFPPGAYCTVLLADLGADVVRIDAPGANAMLFGGSTGIGRGKRSVAVDFRHADYEEVLRRLVAHADVVVDNARPGSLDEHGYGPKQATEEHPSLIWCSITGFGQDGPYASWPGHDLTYLAHSGLLSALYDLPWHPQTVVAVPTGALMAVAAITTALFDRERTRRGAHLDVSLAESATWLLSGVEGHLSDSGWTIPLSPARHLYQCGDGRWVATAADEPRVDSAVQGARPRRPRGIRSPRKRRLRGGAAPNRRRVRHSPGDRVGRRAWARGRDYQPRAQGLDPRRRPAGPCPGCRG